MGGKPATGRREYLEGLGIVYHTSNRPKRPDEPVSLVLRVKDLRSLAHGECNVHTAGLAVARLAALGIDLNPSFLDKLENEDEE